MACKTSAAQESKAFNDHQKRARKIQWMYESIIVDGADSTKYELPALQEMGQLESEEQWMESKKQTEKDNKSIKEKQRRINKITKILEEQQQDLAELQMENEQCFEFFVPESTVDIAEEHRCARISDRLADARRRETQERLARKRKHADEK